MNREDRRKLIHALISASNRFNDTLRQKGYEIYYDGNGRGAIYQMPKGVQEWPVAILKRIEWELKDDKKSN